MTIRYIGLDFEASGSDPWGGNVPIQIGLALDGSTQGFGSLIGGWDWNGTEQNSPGRYDWSEEAFGVHGITKEQLALAPPIWVVDILAAEWLIDMIGWGNRMWNLTVGWNVAGYDRQFVTRWMPNLNRLLSYRTVDLTSLVLFKAKTEADYVRIKKAAKTYADKFNPDGKRHNALVDAKAALHERLYLVTNE